MDRPYPRKDHPCPRIDRSCLEEDHPSPENGDLYLEKWSNTSRIGVNALFSWAFINIMKTFLLLFKNI
jgi:hypothetical protein